MSNAICLLNAALLNQFLTAYYNANRSSFAGTQVVQELDIEFSYEVTTAPVLSFSEHINIKGITPTTPAFSIEMEHVTISLYDYTNGSRGNLLGPPSDVVILFNGVFAVSHNVLSITELTGSAQTGSDIRLLNYVINKEIVPQMTALLSRLPIPQAIPLLGGSQLSINAVGAVKNNNALEVDLSLEGGSGTTTATISDDPQITVALNQDAVQRILNKFGGFPLSKSYSTEHTVAGTGYKAAFTARVNAPLLQIAGNQMIAYVQLYPSLNLTVKNWIKDFHLSPDLPTVSAKVDATLFAVGTDAKLRLHLESLSLHFSSDWPFPFNKIEEAVMDWISSTVQPDVQALVANAVTGLQPTLFTLPTTIPGTPLEASLSFERLGVEGGAVAAHVKIN